jgi:hypothetical protein
MRLRAAAERTRLTVLRRPALLSTTPLNASIARSNFARSSFNCASTAPRSVLGLTFTAGDLTALVGVMILEVPLRRDFTNLVVD